MAFLMFPNPKTDFHESAIRHSSRKSVVLFVGRCDIISQQTCSGGIAEETAFPQNTKPRFNT